MKVDKNIALLYGIMLGDGCLSLVYGRKKFITITGSSDNDLPFFEKVISPILKKLRGKETKIKFRKDCNTIDFNFVDMKLFDFINSLGFPIGKKGTKIIIPEIFYEKNLIKYIAQGFVATDGSLVLTKNPNKYYPRIEAHATCKIVLKQLYKYFVKIGMNGHFYKCKRVNDDKGQNIQDTYKFQFNGKKNLWIFNDKVGFVNPAYQRKFEEFNKYNKEYDLIVKGLASKDVRSSIININKDFALKKMALGGF